MWKKITQASKKGILTANELMSASHSFAENTFPREFFKAWPFELSGSWAQPSLAVSSIASLGRIQIQTHLVEV